MHRLLPLFVACCAIAAAADSFRPLPKLVRIYPLGGLAGASVPVELLGNFLANATGVEFDCADLVWTKTTHSSHGKLAGIVTIASNAPLGPHLLRATTLDGYSTSLIFNVGQFPSQMESEPNDDLNKAQHITQLPVELQGRLDGAPDSDYFSISVPAGERWVFDFKAIERGSAVEARMILLDADGRQLHFNDDRDDYDENPLIDHTFQQAGKYYVKLDQYRGPRGFNFGKNCAYILRVSRLPVIHTASPLGLQKGRTTRLRISGASLQQTKSVFLTKLRHAEYAHMTYPYTMPIDFRPDAPTPRLTAKIVKAASDAVDTEVTVPPATATGLWRLWLESPTGISEGISLEISDHREYDETGFSRAATKSTPYAINGALSKTGEIDVYRVDGRAGQPLHFYTLASQLGVPYLDSVLRLRDASGKKLAENDDVVAGQGTLIGNPDSSLYFTPKSDGPLFLEVFDRLKRGGSGYEYRLEIKGERPGFQLFTTPENFAVARGGTGEIKVHLVREAGFEGEVSVWFEGLPPGIEAPEGTFRADQLFEPNADGADMIIPEITFKIAAPAGLPGKLYTFRVMGCSTAEAPNPARRVVEAHTAVMIGPLLDVWNFVRRPVPAITMTIVDPFDAKLVPATKTIRLEQGKTAEVAIKLDNIPGDASIELRDLPKGVEAKSLGRKGDREMFRLQAAQDIEPGTFAISAETPINGRRASTAMTLTIASQTTSTTEP